MVSSHTEWQDMQAWTQSCIALLIAVMVPGWVMAPPGGWEGVRGRTPCPSVVRLSAPTRHRADMNNSPRMTRQAKAMKRPQDDKSPRNRSGG
ncbi:hypothetical protein SSP24_44110 [Streptomyces spinoverrucosus]|uniref:Uncharacterized protein n=1 Tax=Streptomyces spinoverrucosus TaxID=284043 RepID=A0A4Y3VNY9_9ACTN|nr:hypothetical protein SSP24_44110 [Streptomyces spinoverrucosus]GHB80541.1 hypothetical protein GCM10010397_59240 [Streptomyces spinoverrucosus]